MPPVQRPTHIAVSEVHKRFGGNVVLRDVDIEINAGEVVAVVGPNGSGKTTLLNVISGFVHPDSGSITVNGQDVTHQAPHMRSALGIARTFQVPKLVSGMTVAENIECGAVGTDRPAMIQALLRLPGFRRGELSRRRRATQACQAVGFGQAQSQLEVATLPLGIKRLVEVGRALSADSSVVCMDEPVAGLHTNERALVLSTARSLARSGRAVLIVEHNLPFVLEVCDRLVLLVDGAIVDVGRPEDVTDPSRPLGKYFHTYVVAH
jgi:branched-chain amino acid transport system permease protein